MSLSVLIYGECRSFEIGFKSWNLPENSDIFMSTWNLYSVKNEKLGIDIHEEIKMEKIKDIIPKGNIIIHDEKKCAHLSNSEKMIFHWKSGLSQILSSGKKYDAILLTRTDNFMNGVLPTIKNENDFYCLKSEEKPNEYYVQDIIFMGGFKIMENFINLVPNKFDITDHFGSVHYHLGKIIHEMGIIKKNITGLHVVTIRPNVISLEDIKNKSEYVFDKVIEWEISKGNIKKTLI